MGNSPANLIIQLTPALVLGLIYASLVFVTARKRGVNPWIWAAGTLVPFVGLLVGAVFFFVTILSMLDRLTKLEDQITSETFG